MLSRNCLKHPNQTEVLKLLTCLLFKGNYSGKVFTVQLHKTRNFPCFYRNNVTECRYLWHV